LFYIEVDGVPIYGRANAFSPPLALHNP